MYKSQKQSPQAKFVTLKTCVKDLSEDYYLKTLIKCTQRSDFRFSELDTARYGPVRSVKCLGRSLRSFLAVPGRIGPSVAAPSPPQASSPSAGLQSALGAPHQGSEAPWSPADTATGGSVRPGTARKVLRDVPRHFPDCTSAGPYRAVPSSLK